MAKFVLAGTVDCPSFARAELLADKLQGSLPNFRIHKISILPEEWKGWLESVCKKNGWEHEKSPLIWRELVDRGGKGMLLGGFSDFLEHCQNYYNITLDLPSDFMRSISAENLRAELNFIAEEQHRISQIKPLHIWISSALSLTCHILIPNLLSSEVFSQVSVISLHLLDLEGSEEELHWLKMETEELTLPLLHQVNIHTDLKQAFQDADIIVLLDELCLDDSNAKDGEAQEKEKKAKLKAISDLYTEYGRLIETRAKREVKVIVSNGSFTNLRCSVLLDNVCSIDSRNFIAMATKLENEARAVIARKLKVTTSDVKDVTVWGNISGSFHIDLNRTKIFNYNGPIKGPPTFFHPVLKILYDREWLDKDFQDLVRCEHDIVASKTHRGAAISTANAILTLLKAWNGNCKPDEVYSAGVLCSEYPDFSEDLVLSVPVTFVDGKWCVPSDGTVRDELLESLRGFASELRQEKELLDGNANIMHKTNDK